MCAPLHKPSNKDKMPLWISIFEFYYCTDCIMKELHGNSLCNYLWQVYCSTYCSLEHNGSSYSFHVICRNEALGFSLCVSKINMKDFWLCSLLNSSSFSIKPKHLLKFHLVKPNRLLLFHLILKTLKPYWEEATDRCCNSTSFSTDFPLVYYTNNPSPTLFLPMGLWSKKAYCIVNTQANLLFPVL